MKRLLGNYRKTSSLLMVAAALLAVALVPPGCTGDPDPCKGGILRNGVCEAECHPDECLANNICVDNRCRLLCDSHDDCLLGVQACTAASDDDTGADVTVCLSNGHMPVGDDNGYPVGVVGFGCPFGDFQCVASTCPNGFECDPNSCADCALDEAACAGIEPCNIGKCASTGEACTFNTCSPNECRKTTCLTAGEGDADAYCTSFDCSADSDCPGGFYCGLVRDPHKVCGRTCDNGKCSHDGSNCSRTEDCEKGGALCGETTDPCIDETALTANGQTLVDGSRCLLRSMCVKANECAPCQTNLDCSRGRADVCASHAGAQVCARFCEDGSNCLSDKECLPYGKTCRDKPSKDCTSDADCPGATPCVDRSVCLPKHGLSCQADPAGAATNFCKPCLNDADCGGPGSVAICASVDGQNVCFDSFSTSCTKNADCPQAPSGAHGECLDEDQNVTPSDSVYHTCYFPSAMKDGAAIFTCNP